MPGYRRPVRSKGRSVRKFNRSSKRTHKRNVQARPMRGGFRI